MKLVNGSAHKIPIPDASVHMIVTSPPYFALRAYAGDQGVEWPEMQYIPMPGVDCVVDVPAMTCGLGNEPTLNAYIGHLILCLREWRRVLRDDGTCWVNLGDSFASSGQGDTLGKQSTLNGGKGLGQNDKVATMISGRAPTPVGLKSKDKMLVPHRFALAAQADGWYVRQDIVWAKKNSMPESVTDRPSTAHEFIFLLAKSPRYFYDHVAVQTPIRVSSLERIQQQSFGQQKGGPKDYANGVNTNNSMRKTLENFASKNEGGKSGGANLRSVLHLATQPYKGAHFACFPESIPETAIKAGSSAKGVCGECGNPWVRVVERTAVEPDSFKGSTFTNGKTGAVHEDRGQGDRYVSVSTGWKPSCDCPSHDPVPATVLDPFSGSGTTGRVALRLGRDYIGVDISEEYINNLTPERTRNVQMQICF